MLELVDIIELDPDEELVGKFVAPRFMELSYYGRSLYELVNDVQFFQEITARLQLDKEIYPYKQYQLLPALISLAYNPSRVISLTYNFLFVDNPTNRYTTTHAVFEYYQQGYLTAGKSGVQYDSEGMCYAHRGASYLQGFKRISLPTWNTTVHCDD